MFHTKYILERVMGLSLLASLGVVSFLMVSAPALAAVAPSLASESTYGVVASTTTNLGATTITGDYCCTTCGAPAPTVTGTSTTPCPSSTGTDQLAARVILLAQPCTPVGAGVDLSLIDVGSGPGVYPPGCYSSTGAMSIGSTITLTGDGVYIFRPGGALNAAANSVVNLTNNACASDIYWAPDGATTILANATFAGNIIEGAAAANDITIGSTVTLVGRALAFGHTVNMNNDTITVPTCAPFSQPAPGAPTVGKGFIPPTIVEGGGVGGVSTLTITLSNPNSTAATITSLTDNLPAGVQVAATPNASNTCGATTFNPIAGATTLTMTDGSIPGGAPIPGSCTVTVNVIAPAMLTGSFLNQILIGDLVTSNGSNTAPAVATLTVTPTPAAGEQPPTVGKVFDPVSITVGETSTLTFTLSNSSTDTAITNATFTDTLPTGMVIATPNGATTSGCGSPTLTAVSGTDTIVLSAATIPIAVGSTLGTCTVTVNVTITTTGSFVNTLAAGALTTDQGSNAAVAISTLNGNQNVPITPIPTLNEWGVIFFMVLAGLGAVYCLRKYRRS